MRRISPDSADRIQLELLNRKNAIIKLAAAGLGLVAALLRFVPKAQDGERPDKEKDR